jgi:hypothetical protein
MPLCKEGRKAVSRNLGILIAVACVASLELSCDQPEGGVTAEGFAIYLLADPSMSLGDLRQEDLENLTLAETPLITVKDVKSYSWSDHSFSVTAEALARLEAAGHRPFVVTVNQQRVYLGTFHSSYSSLYPGGVPIIRVTPAGPDLRFIPPMLPESVDLRGDERIRKSLEAAGVLVE